MALFLFRHQGLTIAHVRELVHMVHADIPTVALAGDLCVGRLRGFRGEYAIVQATDESMRRLLDWTSVPRHRDGLTGIPHGPGQNKSTLTTSFILAVINGVVYSSIIAATQQLETNMNNSTITATDRNIARKGQMLRELASDLATMVEAGDITDQDANEWLAHKQDAWFGGDW